MPKADWRRVRFGDVVRLSKARCQDPLTNGFERYVGLEHLEPGDLRIRSWGNVVDGVTFTSVFKPGQVLFGKRRAYQRKVAVANFSGVCSGDIYVLESQNANVLMPELLPFICQTDAFFDHAVGTSAGSLSPRTNWTSLADFEFVLPPPDEQRNIVKCLRASDDLRTSIQSLQVQCEIAYRSAIDDLVHLESNQLIPLDSAAKITDCKHLTPRLASDGIAMISPGIIKWGALNLATCKTVMREEYQRLMDHVDVSVGDLVMGRNQNFGVASYVVDSAPFVLGQDTVLIQPAEMPSHYIYLALRSTFVQRQIQSLSIGTTFKRINLENIRQIQIPQISQADLEKSRILWGEFERSIVEIEERNRVVKRQHSALTRALLS